MRNWPQTLPNASFRGVPFFVEEDGFSDGGRQVAVHEYVKSEVHDTEDMRKKVKKYRLRAYVASDSAEADAQAVSDACDMPGDGVLQTLFFGQITVKCTNCGGTGRRDELGRIWLDLEFIDSGTGSAVSITPIGDRIAASALGALSGLVSAALSAFTGLEFETAMLVDRLTIAYQTTRTLALVLQGLGADLPLSAPAALALRRSVYLIDAIQAPAITAATDVAAIGVNFVGAAAAIAADVAPAEAAPAFAAAAAAAAVATPTFSSPALTIAAGFGRALAACVEAAFLGQGFVATSRIAFGDQQSAVAARARIVATMEGAIDRIANGAGMDVVGLLQQVALTTTDHIATIAADLRAVVQVATTRSAPSTALAWSLYGDPTRAPELVARNAVACSIFMPTRLQALDPTGA